MKRLITLLLVLLILLQVRLWSADGGLAQVWRLRTAITAQQAENLTLEERNRALEAEVRDLKQGVEAIEERARTELGMVKQGETFFQIVDQ